MLELDKRTEALLLLIFSTCGTVAPLAFLYQVGPSFSGRFVASVLSHGNSFAGGIMLGVGVVHMLPDAMKRGLAAESLNEDDALFVPAFYCLIGILIPFFMEKSGLAFWLVQHGNCCTDHVAKLYENQSEQENFMTASEILENQPLTSSSLNNSCNENCTSKCVVPSINATLLQRRLDYYAAVGSQYSVPLAPLMYGPKPFSMVENNNSNSNDAIPKFGTFASTDNMPVGQHEEHLQQQSNDHDHHHHQHHHQHGHGEYDHEHNHSHGHVGHMDILEEAILNQNHSHPEKHNHMKFATFLMFLVLSTHSVIVGFTLGTMSPKSMSSQLNAFGALLLHKSFESLALGVSACHHEFTWQTKIQLVFYNLAAPLGIMIGAIVEDSMVIDDHFEAAILGIASGSFLYIALVEVLAEEFENEEYRIAKFSVFAFGSLVMSYLAKQT